MKRLCTACLLAGHTGKTTCACSCHFHKCPRCKGQGRIKKV